MNKHRCLYCYKKSDEGHLHASCSRKFFGTPEPPVIDYTLDQMLELGEKVIRSHTAITGVQPKLSIGIQNLRSKSAPKKLTIVGLWGEYILKPPSEEYDSLPELEDLSMHLARNARINTVPHTLLPLKSGELCYLTKRIDRNKKKKNHQQEDCAISYSRAIAS
jgi:serine/threonine-protein kinase HipA